MNRRNILTIARKEMKVSFYSPVAYIVMSSFLLLSGWFFFRTFFLSQAAEMRVFFGNLPYIFSFIIPAVTMRLFADEFNTGSYELLVTLPVTTWEIVLGKLLFVFGFIALMLLPTLLSSLTVELVGDLDWGPVIAGYLGSLLLGLTFASIGLWTSSMTKNQIVAWLIGTMICFSLTIMGSFLFFLPEMVVRVFQYLSTSYHFENIAKGLVDFRDLLYFASMIVFFAYASVLVLNASQEH